MSDEIDNGGPAFPITAGQQVYATGMTLRDWFAGQALVGVKGWHPADRRGKSIGAICYEIADAMLAARKGGAA